MIPESDDDLGVDDGLGIIDVLLFEGRDVLKYLNGIHSFAVDDVVDYIVDADRCTTIINRGGVRLRCSFAGVDRWELDGVVVWNRCEDCLAERVEFHDFKWNKKSALYCGVVVHGDVRRFRAE